MIDFRDTILHEVGHVVFDLVLTDTLRRRWRTIHSETGFVWTDAGNDPVEHFSEMYASYILKRALVRMRFPTEHRFLKNNVFRTIPRKEA